MPDLNIARRPSADLTAAFERIGQVVSNAHRLLAGGITPFGPSWRDELDELLGENKEDFRRELAIMESSAERLNSYLTGASKLAEVRKYEKLLAAAKEQAGISE